MRAAGSCCCCRRSQSSTNPNPNPNLNPNPNPNPNPDQAQPELGIPEDALPAEAVLHQLECGASCNEGAPFVLCAATEGAPLWDPPAEALLALEGRWLHGVALRSP